MGMRIVKAKAVKKKTSAKKKPKSKINVNPKKPAKVKSGGIIPDSGIYESTRSKQTTTLVKGKVAPPTPYKNESWLQIVDTNKNN